MSTPTDSKHLKPFLSPLFLKSQTAPQDVFHKKLVGELEDILGNGKGVKSIRKRKSRKSGGLRYSTIEYIQENSPAWAPSSKMLDTRNHLLLVATKGTHCAVCASEPGIRNQLARKTSVAQLLTPSQIEAAFVGIRASVLSSFLDISLVASNNSSPCSVRMSPRAWRWNKITSRLSSKARIWRLTADCDKCSVSPAWVRLPASATA